MRIVLTGCSSLLALALSVHASAQVRANPDSVDVAAAVAAATQHYVRLARPESALFNGPEYVNNARPGTIGHQFFLAAEPQTGSIVYQHASFRDIPLSYDLVLDQVVLTYPGQPLTISLVPEKIASFSLGTHQFVRVVADSGGSSPLPTGFYEQLLAGPVSLLARHTKYIGQKLVQQNLTLEYKQTDRLFARTASAAAEITGLKQLLALLPAHKAAVQRYARQQKLRFSNAQREASVLQALRYYYTLPN